MADTQSFDKLNILKRRSLPYDQYFGEMQLTDKQKVDRKKMALILEDVINMIFEIIFVQATMKLIDETAVKQEFMYDLYDAIEDAEEEFFESEDEFQEYLFDVIDEILKSTYQNLEEHPDDYDYKGEKNYWVSEDRAQFIAENEANTLYNGADFIAAKKAGKKYKIWMAYPDNRVRLTHIETNGSKIPIDAYFSVGKARMLYPKDVTSEFSTGAECPEEVINCRCVAKYI